MSKDGKESESRQGNNMEMKREMFLMVLCLVFFRRGRFEEKEIK